MAADTLCTSTSNMLTPTLLREGVPAYFEHRKLESEFAINFGLGR